MLLVVDEWVRREVEEVKVGGEVREFLVNNCLLVLTLVLTIIPFGSQQCLLRPISIRVYTRAGPVFPKVMSPTPI